MTPSSENREECIVFIFHAQWAAPTLVPRKPTGKPLSQTCVASENGFDARLVFDEAISMPQRAFERRVDRHMTLRGWQSARFTLTPIAQYVPPPRPCGEPHRGALFGSADLGHLKPTTRVWPHALLSCIHATCIRPYIYSQNSVSTHRLLTGTPHRSRSPSQHSSSTPPG